MFKGEIFNLWYSVSVYIHILFSWSEDDPSSGSKLATKQKSVCWMVVTPTQIVVKLVKCYS